MPFICFVSTVAKLSTQTLAKMHHHNHLLGRPCLHCHPHSYIRMVQHLIERCLLLHMSRGECINALAHHASITPLITLTVWRELQKENRHFFQAYFHSISPTRGSPLIMRSHIQNESRFAGRKHWKN